MSNCGKNSIYYKIYLDNHPEISKIPEGYDIHHKDFNHSNNDPDNLELITHAEHSSLHHKNKIISVESKQKISKSLQGNKNSLNRKLSEESKRKISQTLIGKMIGYKHPNWIEPTHEQINDVKNGIGFTKFKNKYHLGSSVYYKIKRGLENN